MMSKIDKVREHLLKYKSITSWEAITLYHYTRLSDAIYKLKRNEGLDIKSIPCRNKETKTNYTKYILEGGSYA